MSNRRNAYTEVYTILQELNEEEYNKIPTEVINAIEENRNLEYNFELDEDLELKEQTLLPQTKAILFNLFRDYLATSEQKEKIIKMQNEERAKIELKKKQEYSTDIFQNNNNSNNNNDYYNEEIEDIVTDLVEYKNNLFKRIWNFLKANFGRKK